MMLHETSSTCCNRCQLKMIRFKTSATILDNVVSTLEYTCVFLLVVVGTHPVIAGYTWGSASRDWRNKEDLNKMPVPTFDSTSTSVTAYIGQNAYLPCRVKNIGDKVVSWIRTKDLHILTSGLHTFTADVRFESAHVAGSPNWTLRLRNVQISDSGTYECQVNTDPKMNLKVMLNVQDISLGDSPYNNIESHLTEDFFVESSKQGPITKILGEEEQFVQIGSTVTFTCLVVSLDHLTSSVEWLKNGRQVSFQAARGGISVDTERAEKRTVSRLTIADVKSDDSGNYTCKPSNTKPHSITLVVIEGERTEAMKHGTSSRTECLTTFQIILVCFFITLL